MKKLFSKFKNKNSMRHILSLVLLLILLQSCNTKNSIGPIEAMHDNLNYEAISGSKGKVYVKWGEQPMIYDSVTIVYSEADASTMLIKTIANKYVYIQGPAVIEFYEFNAN